MRGGLRLNSSPGKLYVVATPIGNLNDLSPRAAETLGSVDFIAAEDTRVTAKILNHIGVKKGLISCQKYNERERTEQIVSRILAGENAAFCSDAGTPVISDPGGTLVSKALDEGITVVMVSHDISSAVKYASHILHLSKKPLFFGTTEDYLKTDAAKAFLGL